MQIGVISEGHSDRAVIASLFTAATSLDRSAIKSLRPTYKLDATDKAANKLEFSTWSLVKKECEDRELIDDFLSLEGNDYIVIQIDTAEADLYEIQRPEKNENYATELRSLVVNKMKEWLAKKEWPAGISKDSLLFAVAVEEIESWLLCIYWNSNDTSTSVKPKEKLQYLLGLKHIDSTADFENYIKLSKPFSKHKDIVRGKFLDKNSSLAMFYTELQNIVIPNDE